MPAIALNKAIVATTFTSLQFLLDSTNQINYKMAPLGDVMCK
jgi:hypothetical protein